MEAPGDGLLVPLRKSTQSARSAWSAVCMVQIIDDILIPTADVTKIKKKKKRKKN